MDTRWTLVEKSDKENSLLRRTLAEELGDKKDNGRKKGREKVERENGIYDNGKDTKGKVSNRSQREREE